MAQDRHRFQLDLMLDDAEANALLRLMRAFETTDVSKVLSQALAFQDLCLNAKATGHALVCRKPSGEEHEIQVTEREAPPLH